MDWIFKGFWNKKHVKSLFKNFFLCDLLGVDLIKTYVRCYNLSNREQIPRAF